MSAKTNARTIAKTNAASDDDSIQGSPLGFAVRAVSVSPAASALLARELEAALAPWLRLEIGSGPADAGPQALFVEGDPAALGAVDRRQTGVYAVVREGEDSSAALALLVEGKIDDIIVRPFRGLEVLAKLRHFRAAAEWREASELNARYAEVLGRFQGDLQLAEKLQKAKLPIRFPDVKGFKVTSRYLAGARSGGNYVDLGESRDGHQVAIVLTDSSSYRLSSALLEALPRVMGALSLEDSRSCITTARRLRDGVLATMSEHDRLSLFYASLSRKDYRLRYVNLGGSVAFYSAPGQAFCELATQGEAIVRGMGVRTEQEGELTLEAGGRLAVFSGGFVQAAGGAPALRELLDHYRAGDAKDTLNELVYRVKAQLKDSDDLPIQDCTGAIFDVDQRLIRLA